MKKSDITKEKILDSAIKIVSEKGFNASSTSEIAKDAEVSEGIIFKYYGSKKGLLTQIVLRTINIFKDIAVNKTFNQIFEEKHDEECILEIIILERISFFRKHSKLMKIIVQELMINETVKSLFLKEILPNINSYIEKSIEHDVEKGFIKKVDSFTLGKILIGTMITNIIYDELFESDLESQNDNNEIVKIIMNGLYIEEVENNE